MVSGTIFTSMLQVAINLLALTFAFSLAIEHFDRQRAALVLGVVFGSFGIFTLVQSVELLPGVLVDLRNPLVIGAGMYGGWLAALVSAGMIALYRLFGVGGVGAIAGAASILTVAVMAVVAHRTIRRPTSVIWLALGLASVFISTGWGVFGLPAEQREVFVANFLPVAVVFYPALTLAIAHLIGRELRQREVRQALAISEQRFHAIFDQTFQFIGLLQPDGKVIEANQTALEFAGIAPDCIVGQYFWETLWWSHSEVAQTELQAAIARAADGAFVRYPAEVAGRDDMKITIDFSLKPIFDAQGRVILIIPEGRDMTDQLRANRHEVDLIIQREMNTFLRHFIEESSHHMRTPITILHTSHHIMKRNVARVRAISQSLRQRIAQGQPTTEDALDELDLVIDSCNMRTDRFERTLHDLTELIENLLALTRVEEAVDTTTEPLDFVALLRSVCEGYADMMLANELTFETTLPDHPIMMPLDRVQWQLVIQNLIDNAIRYTPRGGSIRVACTLQDSTLKITVADQGIGIPADEQAHIFDRFYRATNARHHTSSGSGLGLTIVQSIVTAHGGRIAVDSQVGVGTRFAVTLPLAGDHQALTELD